MEPEMSYDMEPYLLMAQYIQKQCEKSGWMNLRECSDPSAVGVMIKIADRQYAREPKTIDPIVLKAFQCMDAAIAFTMTSVVTSAIFRQITPSQKELIVKSRGTALPIVDTFEDLISLVSMHGLTGTAYLLRRPQLVLVWSNSVEDILMCGASLDELLCQAITNQNSSLAVQQNPEFKRQTSRSSWGTSEGTSIAEKSTVEVATPTAVHFSTTTEKLKEAYDFSDLESSTITSTLKPRPMILTHSLMVAIGLMTLVIVQMGGVSTLIGEIGIDGSYARLAYLLMIPISTTLALFFFTTLVACLFQFFGPVKSVNENTRYQSAIAPDPARYPRFEYPHITIQIPVYKEGLTGVIAPTVESVKEAIKHYESIGGTASIFINEDGMQVVSPELAEARKKFYAANGVGWCSRPPHNKDGFQRKGKFKKASNMNYCLDFSIRVEDELLRLIAEHERDNPDITIEKENELYAIAMEAILAADQGKTWAEGNIRLGEFILLLDCDTKVPVDCLQYGALEMFESPDVAIIQHASGVMQVAHNLFENGITYLTNMIYQSISYAVGSGDLACFVGHNAFLRWKAIQSVAFEEDGKVKYWSDSHVSEDFDQALRLQIAGFIIRLASYHNGGFQEGVSLTVFDELARWEKYTYGCNELLFHPIWKWPFKGPLTPLLWKLISSNVKSTSKVTILGYVFTYYAMAAALPFTVLNYFLTGWVMLNLDHYYLTSFKMMISLLVIFNLVSPIAYNFLLWRLGKTNFFKGMWVTIKWMPFFMVFFGGLSIHLTKAIVCHFFSINMEWASTGKELEETGFFIGMDKIIKDFKYMYIIVFSLTAMMVYLGVYAPVGWKINDFTIVLPVGNQLACHFLLPVVLGLF
ncbi:uncharacterized protein K444DRAFT_592129 [Hyaloscypha bicolor E]|uniref:Uncharacterized protein n=1 Tax=Hyaloscypha bicolor E TaxID=1095630 RepID=A0A2J6T5K3_9HELO|nr:uncharacterized protein K444DRAFT_592129 [Hyaloscypha bicolor E]PMD58223.1 hypothetical protein K444DRAFT_592129 [Hyaloscypha bicolor E]